MKYSCEARASTIRQVRTIIVLASILIASAIAHAQVPTPSTAARDAGPTTFVKQYLARLEREKKAVFYVECHLRDGGKASIVIPLGEKEGVYIERSRYQTVVNTARVVWVNGRWQTDDAQGGIYTLTRLNNLVGELLGNSFQIILPSRLNEFVSNKPKKVCVEKLPQ